jgi:hypothetical protein
MGHAVQTALPVAVLDVYQAPELVLLALSGLAIAVAGALAPPAGRPAPAPPPRCAPSSAPVPGPAGRSGYRGEVGQRIFAAGVHSGIAGSKHQ